MTYMRRKILGAVQLGELAVLLFQHEAAILRADTTGQRFFFLGGCGLRGGGLGGGGLRVGVLIAASCALARGRAG